MIKMGVAVSEQRKVRDSTVHRSYHPDTRIKFSDGSDADRVYSSHGCGVAHEFTSSYNTEVVW